MADQRVATISAQGNVAHLVVARHEDDTVTTLCSYEHQRAWQPKAGYRLCSHCKNVLDELNAAAT
jgi:hypothetical protein